MLNIKKILLPVDFPNTSLRVIHQAAALAHHFHSEIVMLHVVTALSHAAGVPEDGPELARWDMLAEIIRERPRKTWTQSLGPELDGLTIQRMLVKGDAAQAIVQTAQEEKADLIMMPSHGHTFDAVSSRLCDSESATRDRVPGLDRCPRGRTAGAGVCDPQRPVRGRFQPP